MKKFFIFLTILPVVFTKGHCANPSDLTLEQKIGQLLLVHFHGKEANQEAEALLSKAHVGGFIYYGWSNCLENFQQVRNLSLSLKTMNDRFSKIPLFLSTDQEGGRVNRLKFGFSQFPSHRMIGKLDIPELAFETATAQAKELKSAGLNINFAPVVDVDNNPKNPIIGDRSFSSDPEKVILFAKHSLHGYKDQKVLASLKHFPGHGDVTVDSHSNTPVVNKPVELLRTVEWLPFMKLCHDADAIMTAHVLFPSIDPLKPASVSYSLITGLLKNTWGFQGLVISDSLVMKGLIKSEGSVELAALSALQAGTDVLVLGGKLLNEPSQDELKVEDVLRIHAYLVSAVKSGKLSEGSINKSIEKILTAKQRYCTSNTYIPPLLSENEKLEHTLLEREIDLLSQINTTPNPLCKAIAEKVWNNETGSSIEKLLYWNPNEDFLSLGIGHFIWYPESKKTSFEEGFPTYLAFLQSEKIEVPSWITSNTCCPWKNRQEFLSAKQSPQIKELSSWLANTMDLQGKFLLHQLPIALHKIFAASSSTLEKQKMMEIVEKLTSTSSGLYALVDYLNFKGSGLSHKERYKGEGWGLFQALQKLTKGNHPISSDAFANAVEQLLQKRTENAEDPEKEKRWLKGWINRTSTYKQPLNS